MRHLTSSVWVNGLTADDHTVEFYPEGTELNYRAAPHGQWVAIEFDGQALQLAALARLGREVNPPWKHVMSFCVADTVRSSLDRMINHLWRHPIAGTLMVQPILGAIAEMCDGLQRQTPTVTYQKSLRARADFREIAASPKMIFMALRKGKGEFDSNKCSNEKIEDHKLLIFRRL